MKYTADQVMRGIVDYVDAEIMGKLPTSGKWIMGTAIGVATSKAASVAEMLKDNAIAKMLDVVDEDGNIEVDELMTALKSSAEKYGNLSVDVPLMGRMTFSSADVDRLKSYIMR